MDSRNPRFDRFVACNLSVYLLGPALTNPCFCTASVGIRAGFSCSFPNKISHGRSTYDEGRVCWHNRDSYHDIKALSDQMVALIAMVDDNNNNANNNYNNNIKNPNGRGEPIPVIRVRNKNPTIVMHRKSEHTRESDLKYYKRRCYNKLKNDYYRFKISDSIYCCPFCYNKDYSLTDLLRHASRIAGNSRFDIARHSVLITYILSYLDVKVDENKQPDVIDSTILCLDSLLFDVNDTRNYRQRIKLL